MIKSARNVPRGGMVKVHSPNDQELLVKAAGLLFTVVDSTASVKSASSCAITRDMLEAHRPDKDHFLMHVIAMGDHEHYGPNRNADSWPKLACVKYHPTFVTNGYFFREHRNTDPKLSIGTIKASCYNEEQGRIELAVHGRLRPAEGMPLTAEEEYEMAKAGKALSFSMSAKVPNDRCSICGNLAKSASAYCEHMKYSANQYLPEHEKFAFVYNDRPTFFDISKVANPADRIAHHLEYVFAKAASATRSLLGVERALSEGALMLDLNQGCEDPDRQALLEKLAGFEQQADAAVSGADGGAEGTFVKSCSRVAFTGELDSQELAAFRRLQPGTLFRKLAKARVVLPFLSFAAYATGTTMDEAAADPSIKAAAEQVPHAFRLLAKSACCPELESLFDPCSSSMEDYDLAADDEVRRCVAKVASRFSIAPREVQTRVTYGIVHGEKSESIKKANTVPNKIDGLVQAYALYKISALRSFPDLQDREVLSCVAQNWA